MAFNLADQFICSVCDLLKSPAVTKICNAEELKSEFLMMLVAVKCLANLIQLATTKLHVLANAAKVK